MAIKRRRVKAVIQFRRATEEEWIRKDPILRDGEPALSTDINKFKIGDGIRPWSELPYQAGGSGEGTSDYNSLLNLPRINGIQLKGDKSSEDLGIATYQAGNGIQINNNEISLDDLILDCGTSTTNI